MMLASLLSARRLIVWFSLVLLLQAGAIQAQEKLNLESAASEADFLGDIPIVLTATRLRQPINEAPVSITVIDRPMIRASGLQNLAELLRLVPGFQMAQFNGNTFVPTYLGLSDRWSRRMEVQVDGRSVYLPLFSTVDWTYLGISLEDIERIEVIRGSNAPVYGSNAFLGVVNIITRQPFQDRGWFIQGTAGSLYAGNLKKGVEDRSAQQTVNALDSRDGLLRYSSGAFGWNYRATLSYREDDGFIGVEDSRQVSTLSFRATRSPNRMDRIDIQFGYSGGPSGTGVADQEANFVFQQREKRTASLFQSLHWTRSISANNEFSLRFYHNSFEWRDSFALGKASTVLNQFGFPFPVTPQDIPTLLPGRVDEELYFGESDAKVQRFDLEFQDVILLAPQTKLIVGAGLRLDRLKSYWNLSRSDAVEDFSQRIFFSGQWAATSQLLLTAGAMAERNQIIGFHPSPRLAMNYLIDRNRSLRFSATRSIRSPSLMESNAKFAFRFEDGALMTVVRAHDENISEEKLTTLEMGYIERVPRWNLELDAKLFSARLRDAIFDGIYYGYPQPEIMNPAVMGVPYVTYNVLGRTENPLSYINGVDSDFMGLELQLEYKPFHHTRLHAGYAYLSGSAARRLGINASPNSTEPELQNIGDGDKNAIPYHTLSLLGSTEFIDSLEMSAAFYRVTAMNWLPNGGDNLNRNSLPAFNRLDVRLAKLFNVDSTKVHVALILQNLLKDYYEFRRENLFAQRVYLQASAQF